MVVLNSLNDSSLSVDELLAMTSLLSQCPNVVKIDIRYKNTHTQAHSLTHTHRHTLPHSQKRSGTFCNQRAFFCVQASHCMRDTVIAAWGVGLVRTLVGDDEHIF